MELLRKIRAGFSHEEIFLLTVLFIIALSLFAVFVRKAAMSDS